ncbi:MAG TPA: DMT family transporter [Pseudolysinimonas sp.]
MSDQVDVRHPIRVVAATAVAFVSGMLVAVQSRVNGELSHRLDDPFVAAFWSFASGLIVVAIVVAVVPTGRRGLGRLVDSLRSGRMPWWYLLGGVCGALFVLSASIVVALIGVALFTVGVVAGQILSSLLIDRTGMGTMAPKPLSVPRLLGALLALVAVLIAVWGQLQADVPIWALLVPFVAGILAGVQQAWNGQVREVSGSLIAATFVSFVSGTIVLTVALVIHLAVAAPPPSYPSYPLLYLGGLLGCVFISMQAAVVRTIGVLVLGLAILSGQIISATLLDLVLAVEGHPLGITTVVGAALTLVAVGIAAIRRRTVSGG